MKAFILGAGKGTRMNSEIPKPLQRVGGLPLIFHSIDILGKVSEIKQIYVVIGHKGDEVKSAIQKKYSEIKYVFQEDINGTGQSVIEILDEVPEVISEDFIVLNSDDSLFYNPEDIKRVITQHRNNNFLASLFIVRDMDRRSYRKIILDPEGKFDYLTQEISEEGFILSGFYIFNGEFINNYLKTLTSFDGEVRLTDFLYNKDIKDKINCYEIDPDNWFGINTQEELLLANQKWEVKHQT